MENDKEKILGSIDIGKKVFGGIKSLTMFFTPTRIIVAKRTAGAGWWLGLVGAIAESRQAKKKGEKMKAMTPDQILAMDKENLGIPRSEVRSIRIDKKRSGARVLVDTVYGRRDWVLYGTKLEEAQEILRRTVPDKLGVEISAPE